MGRVLAVTLISIGVVISFFVFRGFVLKNSTMINDNTTKVSDVAKLSGERVEMVELSDSEISEIYLIFDGERRFWRSLRSVSAVFKTKREVREIYRGEWRSFIAKTKDSDIEALTLSIVEPLDQVVDSRYPFVYALENNLRETKWRFRMNRFNHEIHRDDMENASITEELAQSIIKDIVDPVETFYDFRNVTEENFTRFLAPSQYDAESESFILTTNIGYRLYFANRRYHKLEGKRTEENMDIMSRRDEWHPVDEKSTFPHKITAKIIRPAHTYEHEIILENVKIVLAE